MASLVNEERARGLPITEGTLKLLTSHDALRVASTINARWHAGLRSGDRPAVELALKRASEFLEHDD